MKRAVTVMLSDWEYQTLLLFGKWMHLPGSRRKRPDISAAARLLIWLGARAAVVEVRRLLQARARSGTP